MESRCASFQDFLPQSPWLESCSGFPERELGSQTARWQRVGGVFHCHVPLEQRLCVGLSSLGPVLTCSLEERSIQEGTRKPLRVAGSVDLG